MARGDIRTQISLEGGEIVRRAFERIGQAGEDGLGKVQRSAVAASAGLAALTSPTTTAGLGRIGAGFSAAGAAAVGAVSGLAGLRAGLAGLGVLGAGAAVTRTIGDVTSSLTQLRNIASGTGFSAGGVKVFQEALEGASVNTDAAGQALTRFADRAGEARLKALGLGAALQNGVQVWRGAADAISGAVNPASNMIEVLRGGQTAVKDLSEPFRLLGINIANFSRDAAGSEKLIVAVAKGLSELRAKDAALATATGVEIFGRGFAQFAEALDRLAKSGAWEKIAQGLRDSRRFPTPEDEAKVKEYEKAWDDLGDKIEEVKKRLVLPALPAITGAVGAVPGIVDQLDAAEKKIAEMGAAARAAFAEFYAAQMQKIAAFAEFLSSHAERAVEFITDQIKQFAEFIGTLVDRAADVIGPYLKEAAYLWSEVRAAGIGAWADIRGAAAPALDWISDKLSSISSFLSDLLGKIRAAASAIGSAVGGALPFAAGGYVRGPGSSTSDSIPARLSDGEFVARAKSVAYYGPDLFAALNRMAIPRDDLFARLREGLNGFSLGGLVARLPAPSLPSVPRFAGGGLVAIAAASGSAPTKVGFPVVIDGRPYSVMADEDVYNALARYRRKRAMVSGGGGQEMR